MTPQERRARENRLYVRILLAERQPDLAAALAFAAGIPCPVCGGILLHVPVLCPVRERVS